MCVGDVPGDGVLRLVGPQRPEVVGSNNRGTCHIDPKRDQHFLCVAGAVVGADQHMVQAYGKTAQHDGVVF